MNLVDDMINLIGHLLYTNSPLSYVSLRQVNCRYHRILPHHPLSLPIILRDRTLPNYPNYHSSLPWKAVFLYGHLDNIKWLFERSSCEDPNMSFYALWRADPTILRYLIDSGVVDAEMLSFLLICIENAHQQRPDLKGSNLEVLMKTFFIDNEYIMEMLERLKGIVNP